MCDVMTKDGWRQLQPFVVNEVWKLCIWDDYSKMYVPSKAPGARLFKIGWANSLPSEAEERGT